MLFFEGIFQENKVLHEKWSQKLNDFVWEYLIACDKSTECVFMCKCTDHNSSIVNKTSLAKRKEKGIW